MSIIFLIRISKAITTKFWSFSICSSSFGRRVAMTLHSNSSALCSFVMLNWLHFLICWSNGKVAFAKVSAHAKLLRTTWKQNSNKVVWTLTPADKPDLKPKFFTPAPGYCHRQTQPHRSGGKAVNAVRPSDTISPAPFPDHEVIIDTESCVYAVQSILLPLFKQN
jgi:hypothetical protein